MEAKRNPERYSPQEWLEDFAEFHRLAPQRKDAQENGAWMNFHFATKYFGEGEAQFRQVRFETALNWLIAHIDAVNGVIGGTSNATEMQITPSVLRMLYVVYGYDHGRWPIPPVALPDMLQLLRKQMTGDKSQGIL